MSRFTRVTFQLFCSMFQMVWFTGKKSKNLANRSTIRGFVLITGLARLILKSLPTLCWLTPLTRTSVSGCQYHAGYPSRETQWEATLQLRYTGSYLQLFSSIFFSKHCCYFTACYQLHLFLDCRLFNVFRACHPWRVFPRFLADASFPRFPVVTRLFALATGYIFSRAFRRLRARVFPLLPMVTSFPPFPQVTWFYSRLRGLPC